ncbi:MAG: HAMP domain-containing protein [Azospirillum sp.]|nr:HAMP domain-containing protein [Azospirillum sp.]
MIEMALTLKAKMLGTVILMAVLALVLVTFGLASLASIKAEVENTETTTDKLRLATGAQLDVISWFRSVESLAESGLSAEALAASRRDAANFYRKLNLGLSEIGKLLVLEESRQELKSANELIAAYQKIETTANQLFDAKKFDEAEQAIIKGATIAGRINVHLEKIIQSNNKLAEAAVEGANAAFDAGRNSLLITAVIGITLGLGIGLFVVIVGVARPLAGITATMTAVAGGDLDLTVPGAGRRDEIGKLAAALETFRQSGLDKRRLETEAERQKKAAESDRKRTLNELADGLESSVMGVVGSVSSAAEKLQSNAQGLSATAEQTSRQAMAVSAASEQATTNVQTVAAAAEELASSVNEISRQVGESSRIATVAVDEANRTNTTVAGLSEAAQKIGEVVGLINNIASQTNLLALNATIEAARAGEAGKGFAVVASEVKNLANQTAKATDDIQAQVAQMQTVTATAVDAIRSITGTIARMSEITTTIASAVEEQGAATQEIARNVQQASAGTQEVSSSITGVTRAAAEAGQLSGDVLGAAKDLAAQAEQLRREVDTFIRRIRSA